MQSDSPTSEPYTFPPLGNLAASAREPAVRPPGKWEQRVWMICFWITFLTLLWQTFWTAIAIARLQHQGDWSFGTSLVYLFASEVGIAIEGVLGVLLAPVALYAFANFRNRGLQWSWYFLLWLIVHAVLTICYVMLVLEGLARLPLLRVVLIYRVGINNAPLWAFLIGLVALRYLPTHRSAVLTPTPEEPINPLA